MASNKITKKDLNEMAVRSMAEQCCFSFERMQAVGFCYGMTKCFRKIHGDNNEEMAAALKNNLDFINTEPHMAAILQGLIVSMEEAGQDRADDPQPENRSVRTSGRFGRRHLVVHRHAHHCLHLLLSGNAEQCSGPHLLHSVLGTDRYLQPHLVRASGL